MNKECHLITLEIKVTTAILQSTRDNHWINVKQNSIIYTVKLTSVNPCSKE